MKVQDSRAIDGLDFPTADEISAIADREDPVLRNLWITWSYYRLNRAMVAVIGDRDLSWCGFATWASKTAGTFIRQEEVPGVIKDWIDGATGRAGFFSKWIARLLGILEGHKDHEESSGFSLRGFAQEVLSDVTGAIGEGNQDVFRNIAPPFSKFLSLWEYKGGRLSDRDREEFLKTLRDTGGKEEGEILARAFTATFDAVVAGNPKARAQAVLYANALIGYVEQTRVQPFIVKSMNAPVADLFLRKVHEHFHQSVPRFLSALFHLLVGPFSRALETEFRHLSTHWMMQLRVPHHALRLGENVPPLGPGEMYPEALDTLDSPQPLELFEQLHATDANESAAHDWTSFEQRMRYIGVLFRSRQEERSLCERPFTKEQMVELKEGRVPAGRL
jgi:hypothetical protein